MKELYQKSFNVIKEYMNFYNDKHPIDIFKYCLEECQKITSSEIGFFHFVNPDKETISLFTWTNKTTQICKTVEASHYPVEQAGIWADPIRNGLSVIHNNYLSMPEEEKKGLPEGHVPLLRELVVPIKQQGAVVALLGVGNKEEEYNEDDLMIVENLASIAWMFYIKTRSEMPDIVSVCSHCKKMKNDEQWYDIRDFLLKYNIKVSDGICPSCIDNHYNK